VEWRTLRKNKNNVPWHSQESRVAIIWGLEAIAFGGRWLRMLSRLLLLSEPRTGHAHASAERIDRWFMPLATMAGPKDDTVRQSNSAAAAAAWLQHDVLARCIVDRLTDQELRAIDRRQMQ
jgi:hypothetical protein